jgi:hypothetical protein
MENKNLIPIFGIVLALTIIFAAMAWADPTVEPRKGKTLVELDEGFLNQLGDLGISPDIIKPGSLRKDIIRFPVRGGGIDLADLRGEIFHAGGLSLSSGGTTVDLTSFIIDTTVLDDPVLTGLVTLNGDLVARVPLFYLDLSGIDVMEKRKKLSISNVGLWLSGEAADALNDIFEVDGFKEDDPIGVAEVSKLK